MTSTYEERTLELQIVSATDLKKVKTLGEQHCYVVAYIYRNQQKATKPDQVGGLNPVWNATLTLTCEEQLLHSDGSFLTVEIHCHGTLHNKLVGTVTVPLHELLARDRDGKKSQVMGFQVLRPSGKPQGTLNMALKPGEVRTVERYQSQQQMPYGGQQSQYPAAGFGAAGPSYRPPFAPQMQYQPQYGAGPAVGYPQMQAPMMYAGGGGFGAPYMGGMGGYGGYPQQRPRRGGGGMGFGTGLMGGALGGLLVGDMLNDVGDNDCGDYGGDGGMDDMGGD